MKPNYRKAEYIAKNLGYEANPDDVLDVLLGHIIEPSSFVADVTVAGEAYDADYEAHTL